MNEIFSDFIEESIESLKKLQSNILDKQIDSIVINQPFFDKGYLNEKNITETIPEFKEIKEVKQPVLYWFELKSSDKNQQIRKKIESYREPLKKDFSHPNYRYTSSYKKTFSSDTKILYVGKVQTGFWGRLVTHLGYSRYKTTAGMQLFHWYDPKEFGELKLHYITFDKDMKYLVTVLEKQLAKKFQPLIGHY